jgi:RHS repeat-associated protein
LESAFPEGSYNPWLNNLNDALANFGEDQLTLEETQKDLPTIESIYPDLSPTTSYKTTTTTRVIYWYHPDYIGNVDLVSDNSGEAYEFFLYSPWGENLYEWNSGTASFSSPYRFNGKELDQETGLAYYGARYYENKNSIWLSMDPLAMHSKNMTMSPYQFTDNNPVILVDPNGTVAGDFYDENDNLLGSDGINDGKIYVIKTNSTTYQNGKDQVPAVGISNQDKKSAWQNAICYLWQSRKLSPEFAGHRFGLVSDFRQRCDSKPTATHSMLGYCANN